MKTHFLPHLQGDDEERAVCGVWLGEDSGMSGDWSRVDCQRCINAKAKITLSVAAEESAIVQQMGDMAKCMSEARP